MPDTAKLYTVLVNTSGKTMTFSYLGAHGKTLAANGTFSQWGSIQDSFGRGPSRERKRRALEADLLAGRIAIKSSPAPVLYDASADAAVANPTVQATVNPTGGGASGGSLAAGNYKAAYTWTNSWGESLVGASLSASFTVGATNIPRVTIPSLPANATAASIYLTDTNGADGTLRRVATGVTGTTYDRSAALPALGPSNPAPPTVNTTEAASALVPNVADNVIGTAETGWTRYTG